MCMPSRILTRKRRRTCGDSEEHFAGLKEAQAEDAEAIGRCHLAAAEIARRRNIEHGYRTVLNVGRARDSQCFICTCICWRAIAGWPPDRGAISSQQSAVSSQQLAVLSSQFLSFRLRFSGMAPIHGRFDGVEGCNYNVIT